MRLIDRSAVALALPLVLAGSRLFAQTSASPVRIVAAVDSAETFGFAEPSSGRFVIYASADGIRVLNRRTGKLTTTIDPTTAVLQQSYFGTSVSISASGRRLVFLAAGETKGSHHVWSVDLDTVSGNPVAPAHRVSIMPAEALSISDDGRWIALVTSEAPPPGTPRIRKLLVMPSDGGDERMLDSAGRIQTPHWTPDGKAIYYIRGRGKGPALMRVASAGGKPDSLAPAMAVVGVSADGRRVAYYPPAGGERYPLRIADLQGREIGTVVVAPTDFVMAWSRRDPAVMFGRRDEAATSFKVMSLDDGRLSPYPVPDRFASHPRFSPDGRQLATVSVVDDRAQLVVFDAAGKQRRVLRTAAEPDNGLMEWSPDGSRIAFLALDSSLTRHELYVVDVATSRATRLAEFERAARSNAVLFRWRADGQAIDYVTGAPPHGGPTSLERVTLDGSHSVIRSLPTVPHGPSTDGGYRLLNDSLIAIGRDFPKNSGDSSYLELLNLRTGASPLLITKPAYWQMGTSFNILSPDGKWIAIGSTGMKDNQPRPQWAVLSIDGKTTRLLGETMPCDAWPYQWLPGSRSLIAYGVQSCDSYEAELYVVPIDGGPARHLPTPANLGLTLTPDGRNVLVAAFEAESTSIIAVDVAKAMSDRAEQAGKPRKPGQN
jgi:Tol biopolymer transport system component